MADKKKEQAMVVSQEQIADGIVALFLHKVHPWKPR